MSHYTEGIRGEDTARIYLEKKGYKFIQSRYRGEDGEIDLIMQDGGYVVFVEVKSRKTSAPGSGLMAVTPAKQKRCAHAAARYIADNNMTDSPVRFDVVEISRDGIIHIQNAFQPGSIE